MTSRSVGRPVFAVLVLLVLAGAGWLSWVFVASSATPSRDAGDLGEAPGTSGNRSPDRPRVESSAHVEPSSESTTVPATRASPVVRLRIVGGETGDAELPEATVRVIAEGPSSSLGGASLRGIAAGGSELEEVAADSSGGLELPANRAGTRALVRAPGHQSRVICVAHGELVQTVALRPARTVFFRLASGESGRIDAARCTTWVRDAAGVQHRSDFVRPDAEGVFELRIPDDAAQAPYFRFDADGFVSAWVFAPLSDEGSRRDAPVVVELRRAPSLHVACFDAESGEAIAGAQIREDQVRLAETDHSGTASFPVAGTAGVRHYFAVAPGYGETLFYAHVNEAGELVDSETGTRVVRLRRSWALTGRVVVKGNGDVPNGTVVTFRQRMEDDAGAARIFGPRDSTRSTTVRADGTFELRDLGSSTAQLGNELFAICPDGRVGRYVVAHRGPQQFDIELESADSARNTEFVVRCRSGRALTGGKLTIRWLPGRIGDLQTAQRAAPPLSVGAVREFDLAGTEARVRVPLWPSAYYEATITDANSLPERLTLRAGDRERVDVELLGALRVRGRVVDDELLGVGGVFVAVSSAHGTRVEPLDLQATWPGGEFQLTVPERHAQSDLTIIAQRRRGGKSTGIETRLRIHGVPAEPLQIVLTER